MLVFCTVVHSFLLFIWTLLYLSCFNLKCTCIVKYQFNSPLYIFNHYSMMVLLSSYCSSKKHLMMVSLLTMHVSTPCDLQLFLITPLVSWCSSLCHSLFLLLLSVIVRFRGWAWLNSCCLVCTKEPLSPFRVLRRQAPNRSAKLWQFLSHWDHKPNLITFLSCYQPPKTAFFFFIIACF